MKAKIIIFFLIVSLVLFSVIYKKISLPSINITHVECLLDFNPCPIELSSKLDFFKHQSLFFTNVEKKIPFLGLNSYQFIKLERILPSTLKLSFSSTPTNFIIIDSQTGTKYQISNDLFATPDLNHTALPQIFFKDISQHLSNNHLNQQTYQAIKEILSALYINQLEIEKITWMSNVDIEIELKDQNRAIIDTTHITQKIITLMIILTKLDLPTIDLNIKEIDLRYKLPILRSNFSTIS